MLVIGAEREHPLPARWMDSQVPGVHLVITAPQVTGLSSVNKQSASSCFSAAIWCLKCIKLQAIHIFKIMFFVIQCLCSFFHRLMQADLYCVRLLTFYPIIFKGYNVLFMLITIWCPTESTEYFTLVLSDMGHLPMLK